MNILLRELKYRLKQVVLPVIGLTIVGYLGFHSVQGERGILSMMRLTSEVSRAEARLSNLSADRARLEHQVSLLHPKSLDPDMLEEQARYTLNYANPRDVIIFNKP
ncbi:MAG: septum formation initiator family protein [Alphaproteobacteria bacterium]|nr:septum formation initiator family protein [Alphaproteobacteria bacterium]